MKKLITKIVDKIRNRKKETPAPTLKRGCGNCKHTDKSFDEDPCCYCDRASDWEAK